MIGYGNGAHYQVRGKQVACSKITKTSKAKHHRDDYACAFDVDKNGNILAGKEAFNPQTFDLAKTATGSNVFKGTSGRSLASVSTAALPPPDPSYGKSHAYLVYEAKGRQRQAENALIVFRGSTAKDIMGMLKNGSPGRVANYGESKGRKGNEIACVESTGKEPERCALVISFRDGSVTRSGNPLFR